jgi:DNA-binding response OmpR family regulator
MPRILVVDDEIHIRMLYARELEDEGYDVAVAATPEEALRALRVSRPDLVVLDIELEDSNGLDLLNRIRQEFRDLFVVINSAYSTYKADFQTWLADAYIMKSSDLKPLKEKVRQLLTEGACDRTI